MMFEETNFEWDPEYRVRLQKLVGASQRAYAATLAQVTAAYTTHRASSEAAVLAAFEDHSDEGALLEFPDTPRDAIAACPFPYSAAPFSWEAFVASYGKAVTLLESNFNKEVAKL
tara:strand:+ start:220 stop:564 length:345 start_codon:yes stop_codon:yes gene_type:complete